MDWSSSDSLGHSRLACACPVVPGLSSFNQLGSPWQFPCAFPTSGRSLTMPVDLAFGTSFSSCFLLVDPSVSFHGQHCCTRGIHKCCPVSCIELGAGAWVILGGGAGSMSSLQAAPSPSKASFGWLPLPELLWMPACPAQPCSRLVACPGITVDFTYIYTFTYT